MILVLHNVRPEHRNMYSDVPTGVNQGSVISPLLFLPYMCFDLKRFKEGRIREGARCIMVYAGDINL